MLHCILIHNEMHDIELKKNWKIFGNNKDDFYDTSANTFFSLSVSFMALRWSLDMYVC